MLTRSKLRWSSDGCYDDVDVERECDGRDRAFGQGFCHSKDSDMACRLANEAGRVCLGSMGRWMVVSTLYILAAYIFMNINNIS